MQEHQRYLKARSELTKQEKESLAKVHHAYNRELSTAIPIFLIVDESNRPVYNLGDFEKNPKIDLWSRSLKEGLLKPHAQRMIHWIVQFFQSQSEPSENPVVLMVCRELIDWITDLPAAMCNAETIDTLKRRDKYLDSMTALGCFSDKDPIINLFVMLIGEILKVLSDLELKIFENRQTELLESTINAGKDVLSNGFNYLYYILSDAKELPYPNFVFFSSEDPIYEKVARTRAGQLLTRLRHSAECRFIFPRDIVLGSTENELSLGISPNPFLRSSHQSLLPSELLQDIDFGGAMDQGLPGDVEHSVGFSAGILDDFNNNPNLLATFLKLHALLKDWATIIFLCIQFRNKITLCPRVLESDDNHERARSLMKTLQTIGDALIKCEKELSFAADQHASTLQKKKFTSKQQQRWLQNFRYAKPFGTHLFEAIDSCLNQTRYFEEGLLRRLITPMPEQSVSFLRNPMDYFFGTTVGASKRAVVVPKVQTIRMGEVEYLRHPVEEGEDGGYKAFEMGPVEAYQCLYQHITSVRYIVKPVLQEVLFANEEFANWLSNDYSGVKKTSSDYHAALQRKDPGVQNFWDALYRCCEDLNLVDQFIVYNVLHTRVDKGKAHPLILCALAHSLRVSLCFYEINESGQMIPHARYKGHTPAGATETIELLVTENNQYETVKIKSGEDLLSRSKFGAGSTHFQPAPLPGELPVQELPVQEVASVNLVEQANSPRISPRN